MLYTNSNKGPSLEGMRTLLRNCIMTTVLPEKSAQKANTWYRFIDNQIVNSELVPTEYVSLSKCAKGFWIPWILL